MLNRINWSTRRSSPPSADSGPLSAKRVSPRTLTLGLLLFLFVNALVLNGVLWLAAPEPYKETTLQHTWDVLQGKGGDDSWGVMDVALDQATQRPEELLYTRLFFTDLYRFQYPTSALFAMQGLRWLAPDRVQTQDDYDGPYPPINTVVGWGFLLLTGLSVAALLEHRLRRARPDADWRQLMSLRVLIVAAFTLTFYPIVKGFTLGQIQVWINGLFALALLAWTTRWKASSGFLIGLVSLIKPHYGLMLVWALLRGEKRFATVCAATIAAGVAAAVAVFGLANNLDYVKVLSFLSRHGEAFYPNQSVNGVLNRLMSIVSPDAYKALDLPAGVFPPFTPWIYALTVLSSAMLLIAALVRGRKDDGSDRTLDFCVMALSCTMASPLAWDHHYGVALPIFAVALASVLDDRTRLTRLALAFTLLSTFILTANMLAATPLNLLQSTMLAGAVMLLMLLHGQMGRAGRPGVGARA
jgi:hypothetical protein